MTQCAHTHTLSHTYIHTYTHTYIQHTYIQHAYMHTCIHTYCTYIYTYMYIHTCTFTHKYIPREYCESLQSSVVRAASALCVHTHMHTYIHTYIPWSCADSSPGVFWTTPFLTRVTDFAGCTGTELAACERTGTELAGCERIAGDGRTLTGRESGWASSVGDGCMLGCCARGGQSQRQTTAQGCV